MKNFLIGCGVVVLLLVGGLVAGGFWVWNNVGPQFTQGVQQLQNLEREVQRVLPNVRGLNINVQSANGQSVLRINAPVPFDPTAGQQAANTANEILRIARQNLPTGLVFQQLEVRLFRDLPNGSKQERIFKFPLTQRQ
jgi:predicted PurR-regulated permease PerM